MWVLRIEIDAPSYDYCGEYLDLYFETKYDAETVGGIIGQKYDDDGFDLFATPSTERIYLSAELFEQEIHTVKTALEEFKGQFRRQGKLRQRIEDALANTE